MDMLTKSKNKRAWQRMLSGRRLDILFPSPLDIEIEDIAQGLSRVARWNGQTIGKYSFSVAEHSLLVERIFSSFFANPQKKWQLSCLLHDSSEYVIGDMISPFKNSIGGEYRKVEKDLLDSIHLRFNLPTKIPNGIKSKIKKADKIAAFIEATQLAGFTINEAKSLFCNPNPSFREIKITSSKPSKAKKKFLERFFDLYKNL